MKFKSILLLSIINLYSSKKYTIKIAIIFAVLLWFFTFIINYYYINLNYLDKISSYTASSNFVSIESDSFLNFDMFEENSIENINDFLAYKHITFANGNNNRVLLDNIIIMIDGKMHTLENNRMKSISLEARAMITKNFFSINHKEELSKNYLLSDICLYGSSTIENNEILLPQRLTSYFGIDMHEVKDKEITILCNDTAILENFVVKDVILNSFFSLSEYDGRDFIIISNDNAVSFSDYKNSYHFYLSGMPNINSINMLFDFSALNNATLVFNNISTSYKIAIAYFQLNVIEIFRIFFAIPILLVFIVYLIYINRAHMIENEKRLGMLSMLGVTRKNLFAISFFQILLTIIVISPIALLASYGSVGLVFSFLREYYVYNLSFNYFIVLKYFFIGVIFATLISFLIVLSTFTLMSKAKLTNLTLNRY